MKGRFTIKNGSRAYSNIGVDQAHEQDNILVKIEGGAISIFDNPKELLRWDVAGPIVAQTCKDAKEVQINGKESP